MLAVQNLGDDSVFRRHLVTSLATGTDGHVILILLLQLQTRRHLTPATKRQFGMVRDICNRQPNALLIAWLNHSVHIP